MKVLTVPKDTGEGAPWAPGGCSTGGVVASYRCRYGLRADMLV